MELCVLPVTTKHRHHIAFLMGKYIKLLSSGCIEFEEFLNMMKKKMKENENSMDDVKAAFKVFDQNGDGYEFYLKFLILHFALPFHWSLGSLQQYTLITCQ